MKTATILLILVFLWIDHLFKIRNSILLIELMGVIIFYFGGQYVTSTLRYRRKKTEALKSDRGYRNPKEIKNWRDYKSHIKIAKTKELDYFDKL